MSKVSRYKSKIEMKLINGNNIIDIPSPSVVSIVIDSDYENRAMPIIFATLNIATDIYNKLIEYHNNGRIYLNVKYYDANTSIPFYKDRIKGQFIYFTPDNYDYRTPLQDSNPNVDNSYNKITIGMMSAELINFNGQTFNGTYNKVTTQDLVNVLIAGRDFVVDNIDNTKSYESFFIPPINNRSEAIKYIFEETYFFNKKYIYFNDFDTSYLVKIDSKKKSTSTKPNSVIFRVNKLNVADAYYEGMIKNAEAGTYLIYANNTNMQYDENNVMDKIVTNVSFVSDDGVNNTSLNIVSNSNITPKKIYTRENDSSGIESQKSVYESSSVIVNISKSNVDGSIFTPNMTYKIDNAHDNYSKYNGVYAIMYRREVIMKQDNEYNNVVVAGFRRLE